jgi:hypothetical protein
MALLKLVSSVAEVRWCACNLAKKFLGAERVFFSLCPDSIRASVDIYW